MQLALLNLIRFTWVHFSCLSSPEGNSGTTRSRLSKNIAFGYSSFITSIAWTDVHISPFLPGFPWEGSWHCALPHSFLPFMVTWCYVRFRFWNKVQEEIGENNAGNTLLAYAEMRQFHFNICKSVIKACVILSSRATWRRWMLVLIASGSLFYIIFVLLVWARLNKPCSCLNVCIPSPLLATQSMELWKGKETHWSERWDVLHLNMWTCRSQQRH